MNFSGDLCDMTMHNTVEHNFIDNDGARSSFKMLEYARYKDDIFVIIDRDVAAVRRLASASSARSTVWRLSLESVSSSSVDFVDLHISRGCRWGATRCLDIEVHYKPSTQKVYLSATSFHQTDL